MPQDVFELPAPEGNTAEGESWFWQRRLAQPVFQQKRIDRYGATMVEYTHILHQVPSYWCCQGNGSRLKVKG